MTSVQLGDVLKLSYGKALKQADRSGGPYPVVGSGGVVGRHDSSLTTGPTIVVGRKGSIGSVTWIDGPAWPIDTAYFVEPLSPSLDLRWTYWALQSLGLAGMNKSAAIPGLNREDVYRLGIRLPALSEQRRIAAILDHADALRAKRRQVLAHLDGLTQSIFHDMFGDGEWPRATLNDVTSVSGEYGANVSAIDMEEGLPRYVRITDIDDGGRLRGIAKAPGETREHWGKYSLADGDLLFARSGATVGKAFRYREVDGPCVFAGYLIRFRLDRSLVNPDFLFAYTRGSEYLAWVSARQNVVAQPNINAKQYGSELAIPVPPIDLQDEFSRRVAEVSAQRDRVVAALEASRELFASLQSRAFRGEL